MGPVRLTPISDKSAFVPISVSLSAEKPIQANLYSIRFGVDLGILREARMASRVVTISVRTTYRGDVLS